MCDEVLMRLTKTKALSSAGLLLPEAPPNANYVKDLEIRRVIRDHGFRGLIDPKDAPIEALCSTNKE